MIEPEFGLNIGYVARAMSNFGLSKLILISEAQLMDSELQDAKKFASHAKPLIEDVRYVPSVINLRKKFRLLIGTTAIQGTRRANLTRKTMEAEACAERLSRRITSDPSEVCLVFGRDTTGMTNEELRLCDYNITIQASKEYNTLNISHALAIILFVFSKHLARRKNTKRLVEPRTRIARDRTIVLFDQLAAVSGFQKFKADMLKETVGRIIDRADPSLREIYLLMGLASKATGKIRRLSSLQQ